MTDTMQVGIDDVANDETKTIFQRNLGLREALGDAGEACVQNVLSDLKRNGSTMYGGGAIPLFEIRPAAIMRWRTPDDPPPFPRKGIDPRRTS